MTTETKTKLTTTTSNPSSPSSLTKDYWTWYYSTRAIEQTATGQTAAFCPRRPVCAFAQWFCDWWTSANDEDEKAEETLLELGCGEGIEGGYFADTFPNVQVICYDACSTIIQHNQKGNSRQNLKFISSLDDAFSI